MTTRLLKTATGKRVRPVLLHCPSCRSTQKAKPIGTATIAGVRREVMECQGTGCGLQWIPTRTAIPAAA